MTKYFDYEIIAFNRKSGEELYKIGNSKLTEKEAINMQIDLSTPEKVVLLRKLYPLNPIESKY